MKQYYVKYRAMNSVENGQMNICIETKPDKQYAYITLDNIEKAMGDKLGTIGIKYLIDELYIMN